MRTTRTRLVGVVVAVVALAAVLATSAPAHADEIPKGAKWTEEYFESDDGTVLHADVFRPKDFAGETPVILAIGPYFNSAGYLPYQPASQGPTIRFPELFTEGRIMERGYSYVQVDLRGFGSSGGCYDFGGPGEQMDVKAAVEWAASQPWSNGKVAMWGKSYDGWTGVMALATKPKGLAAAVIQSPIIEGYRTLFMNGVHYDYGWYLTPSLYAYIDVVPPSLYSDPREFQNALVGTATNPDCYAENLIDTTSDDPSHPYWKERELIDKASGSKVPVLWSHGFMDANTKPDNFMDIWSTLKGPHRAWFGQYDHVRGNEDEFVGREGFMSEAMAMFDRFLKGEGNSGYERLPRVEIQQDDGKWRTETAWPPKDATPYGLPIKEGSYVDEPGNTADGGSAGNGTWTFTQPLPYDVHLAGVPKLTVDVEPGLPGAHLIALVYDVDAKGEATRITEGAFKIGEAGKASFELYPQDWRVEKGHRLGILLSGSDEDWFSSVGTTNLPVEVSGGELSVPFLRFDRDELIEGGAAEAMSSRNPFAVDEQTIRERTLKADLPPKLKHR